MATKKKKRGRKPGPNQDKINIILRILESNPKGIWVREISRITGLKRSTISLYLNTHLADKVVELHDKSLPIKLVKLKKQDDAPDYVS